MKMFLSLIAGCIMGLSYIGNETSLVSLANPLQGTDSTGQFSHGNEYPVIALPFPMNTWSPYTQMQNDSFFYQYQQQKSAASDRRISQTLG